MPGLGQTGWGAAGWVRGLKAAEAVMSPLCRPAGAPPCPWKSAWLPTPGRPTHSTQAPYLGKDTKLEQSVGGSLKHSLHALEMLRGWGGAVPRAAGKTFYGQDPENLSCYPDLGLLFNEKEKRRSREFGPTKEHLRNLQRTNKLLSCKALKSSWWKLIPTAAWLRTRHYAKAFLSHSALL